MLGLARRGFFIPHRHADAVPPPGERPPYAAIEALLAAKAARFREVLGWLDALADEFARFGGETAAAGQPRWRQSWFPRLDAAVAYALVRRFAPRRVVEIGSGHSTRFLARAVADGGLDCRIAAIDPAPRAAIAGLAVELHRVRVQEMAPERVAGLAAGDFLLIDSSHILMPGSDVDFLLGRVLPLLPAGTFVQFHDIFLPDDYPIDWDWRGYNEQLGVLPLLRDAAWEVIFASHYAATRMAADVAACAAGALPLPAEARESSLWLRRR